MASTSNKTQTFGRLDQETELTNDHLLIAFRKGDMEALKSIYVMHSPALFAYGKRLCDDHQLIADIIQDVFVDAWVQRSSLSNIKHIRYYMFRMLRNKLARAYRSKANIIVDSDLITHQTGMEPSAEQFIIQQETQHYQHRHVQQAVAQLPDRQREAVMLAFYHNFTNDQIAVVMGISHQSVINHLNRAFKSLRGVISFIKMAGLLYAFCV